MNKTLQIKDLKNSLKKIKEKKALIITGYRSFNKSGAKKFFKPFFKNKNFYYYYKKFSYPDIKELINLIKKIKEIKPKYILAIGGGAVMDLSKISNYLIFSKDIKKDIIKSNYKYKKRFSKLVAIPTTAGSGAEVTSNAVIYINKKKYSVENNLIRPNKFYLIPNFVQNNNFKLKSSSGFDAIAQGVESLFSLRSNKKSYNFAINSLKLSLVNFPNYLKNPNTENSKNMIKAANLSGEAINISKTTAPHALSYPFTSYFGINHGHAVAITFKEFLNYNFNNKDFAKSNFDLDKRFRILFKLTQTQNIFELTKFFEDIDKKAKIKVNFSDLNINISKSIDLVLKNVNIQRLSNNPVNLDYNSIRSLLLKKK